MDVENIKRGFSFAQTLLELASRLFDAASSGDERRVEQILGAGDLQTTVARALAEDRARERFGG